jgi:hypothetical protein
LDNIKYYYYIVTNIKTFFYINISNDSNKLNKDKDSSFIMISLHLGWKMSHCINMIKMKTKTIQNRNTGPKHKWELNKIQLSH